MLRTYNDYRLNSPETSIDVVYFFEYTDKKNRKNYENGKIYVIIKTASGNKSNPEC